MGGVGGLYRDSSEPMTPATAPSHSPPGSPKALSRALPRPTCGAAPPERRAARSSRLEKPSAVGTAPKEPFDVRAGGAGRGRGRRVGGGGGGVVRT